MTQSSTDPVRSRITARLGRVPTRERTLVRPQDLDLEREACGDVARMRRAAVPAWARRERAEQVDLGEELDEIARPHRTRLHEILMRVAREARAHEDVQHVVDHEFRLAHV